MRPKSSSRARAFQLILSSVLFAPSLAYAQTVGGAQAAPAPQAAPPATPPGEAPAAASTTTSTSGTETVTTEATTASAVEAPPEEVWAERDRLLHESSTLSGAAGLLHMQHAQGSAPGQLRIGFTVDYFSSGFLCTSDFPCPSTRTGGSPAKSDTLDHIGGTLSLGVGITKWLEAYASTMAYANSDDKNRPTLLQVLGDSIIGAKAHFALNDIFRVGGFFDLWLINGTGSVGLKSAGLHIGPIFTADLRAKGTPLRFSAQMNYTLDNTGTVIESTEKSRGTPVTRIERFGLGVNRVDHFDMGFGGEFFAVQERIRPFVEYNLQIPSNRQNYRCRTNNPSGDLCMANETVVPSKLTLGSRFFPWKRGLGFTAALDIGVTGTSTFVEELSPTAPWTLFLGAGWAGDTEDRPSGKTKTIEKATEMHRPKIVAKVHEREKADGLANATATYTNHPEWSGHIANASGIFTTQEVLDGKYLFLIHAEGYKDGTCEVDVKGGLTKEPQEIKADCALEALAKVGTVVGTVRDAETQAPVGNATVKVRDANGKEFSFTSDAQGHFRGEPLGGGNATFTVEAEGFLALVQTSELKIQKENTIDLPVAKRPKSALVLVTKKEVVIKQQIQFAVDSAQILPVSTPLMTEIADALIHSAFIHRVEVQGHTDNSGSEDHNKLLSEQRAQSVVDWLSGHGVTASRLVARGYGQSKPLVPNVTTGNKAKNRRVQFIILDQDAPLVPVGPVKGATPAPTPAKKLDSSGF